jgi:hypothetical protein
VKGEDRTRGDEDRYFQPKKLAGQDDNRAKTSPTSPTRTRTAFRARGAMGGPDDFLSELSNFRTDCKSVVFRLSLRGTLGSAASSTSVFPLPPTQNRV